MSLACSLVGAWFGVSGSEKKIGETWVSTKETKYLDLHWVTTKDTKYLELHWESTKDTKYLELWDWSKPGWIEVRSSNFDTKFGFGTGSC